MFHVVTFVAEHQFGVVTGGLEGFEHHLIVDGPASGVERAVRLGRNDVVVLAILQKDAYRLGLRFPDEGGQGVSALHGDVGADEAEHAMELVRTIPGGHERAHGSGADAGEGVVVGILGEVVFLRHFRDQLLQQKARIPVAQGVILKNALKAVLRLIGERGKRAGIDEDPDQRR